MVPAAFMWRSSLTSLRDIDPCRSQRCGPPLGGGTALPRWRGTSHLSYHSETPSSGTFRGFFFLLPLSAGTVHLPLGPTFPSSAPRAVGRHSPVPQIGAQMPMQMFGSLCARKPGAGSEAGQAGMLAVRPYGNQEIRTWRGHLGSGPDPRVSCLHLLFGRIYMFGL